MCIIVTERLETLPLCVFLAFIIVLIQSNQNQGCLYIRGAENFHIFLSSLHLGLGPVSAEIAYLMELYRCECLSYLEKAQSHHHSQLD